MASSVGVRVGLATLVVAAGSALSGCAHTSPRATDRTTVPPASPAPTPSRSAAPDAATNVAAATAEGRRLLAAVTVPPGSTRVPTAPTPDLRSPAEEPAADDQVDAADWWTVPLPAAAALAWLDAHRAAGLTAAGSSSGTDGERSQTYQAAAAPAYQPPRLTFLVVPTGPHASGLRADAQVVWYPDRSAAEKALGAGVTTATVSYRRTGKAPFARVRVLTGPAARRLAAAVDALPAQPPATYSCPAADAGLQVAFSTGLVAATGNGCAAVTVSVSVRGRAQPSLVPRDGLVTLLLADLHLPPDTLDLS